MPLVEIVHYLMLPVVTHGALLTRCTGPWVFRAVNGRCQPSPAAQLESVSGTPTTWLAMRTQATEDELGASGGMSAQGCRRQMTVPPSRLNQPRT
jgi:hypothetical protein